MPISIVVVVLFCLELTEPQQTCSFVPVSAIAPAPVKLVTTQFSHQVKNRLILQLIKDIPKVLQTLLKHFHGTAT